MLEIGAVQIEKGGITGPIVERIFFGSSRQQLEGFWGIKSLEDLSSVDSIALPNKAAKYRSKEIDDTQRDGRERIAVLGFEEGEVTVRSEGVGTKSLHELFKPNANIDRLEPEVGNRLKYYFLKLFDKPQPLLFHTHPQLDTDSISGPNWILAGGIRKPIPVSAAAECANFILESFSADDISALFKANRYHTSLLLGTSSRDVYVAPSKLSMKYGMTNLDQSHVPYEKELELLYATAQFICLGLSPTDIINSPVANKTRHARETYEKARILADTKPTLGELKNRRDKTLTQVCNGLGYEVFISRGQNRDILYRVKS